MATTTRESKLRALEPATLRALLLRRLRSAGSADAAARRLEVSPALFRRLLRELGAMNLPPSPAFQEWFSAAS